MAYFTMPASMVKRDPSPEGSRRIPIRAKQVGRTLTPHSLSHPTHLLPRKSGGRLEMRHKNRRTDRARSTDLTRNNDENGETRLKDVRITLLALAAQVRLPCLALLRRVPKKICCDETLFIAPRPRAFLETACGIERSVGHVQSIAGWRSNGCSLWVLFLIVPESFLSGSSDSFHLPSLAELEKDQQGRPQNDVMLSRVDAPYALLVFVHQKQKNGGVCCSVPFHLTSFRVDIFSSLNGLVPIPTFFFLVSSTVARRGGAWYSGLVYLTGVSLLSGSDLLKRGLIKLEVLAEAPLSLEKEALGQWGRGQIGLELQLPMLVMVSWSLGQFNDKPLEFRDSVMIVST